MARVWIAAILNEKPDGTSMPGTGQRGKRAPNANRGICYEACIPSALRRAR